MARGTPSASPALRMCSSDFPPTWVGVASLYLVSPSQGRSQELTGERKKGGVFQKVPEWRCGDRINDGWV